MQLKKQTDNPKVLLHACCAICSGYPITFLRDNNYEPVIYFFNPNIYPETEFEKRLVAQKTLCENFNCELIVENYTPEIYFEAIKGFENTPEKGERCTKCFELRLSKTTQKAKELGIKYFTTSLSISPHKNLTLINSIAKKLAEKFELTFLDYNFRKNDGLIKTNTISKNLNLYRQDYCGCKMSLKERDERLILKTEKFIHNAKHQ